MSEDKGQYLVKGEPAAVAPHAPDMLAVIREIAVSENPNIEALERLVQLQERFEAGQARKAFAAAMARVQAAIAPVIADAYNDQTKSYYAKLHALDRAIRPHYTAEGLSVTFGEADAKRPEETRYTAICRHALGHAESIYLDLPPDDCGPGGKRNKTGVHAKKSSNTYAQGILLARLFNVAIAGDPHDDDGNAAGSGGAITEAEADELTGLLRESGADIARFYRYAGCADIYGFPRAKLAEARRMLKEKIAAKGGAA